MCDMGPVCVLARAACPGQGLYHVSSGLSRGVSDDRSKVSQLAPIR